MTRAASQWRCAAVAALVYFAVLYVLVNVWSAIDIFAFGNFDGKFGGPMDNLLLGLRLTALGFLFCALGCFTGVLLLRFQRELPRRSYCWWTGGLAAIASITLFAAELLPWFGRMVPGDNAAIEFSVALILVGFVSGGVAAPADAILERWRRRAADRAKGRKVEEKGA